MKFLLLFSMVLVLATPALAQDEAEPAKELTILERAQRAAELIQASQEARSAGIPEEEVKEVLEGARDRGLTPDETEAVLSESTAAVEESGPVDNFGAFVQARLDDGLRGKELAAAIHEEHKLHGKGKGHGKDKGKGKGHGHSHDKKEMKKNKKDRPSEGDGHRHGDDENDSEDHEGHEGHDEDDQDEEDGKGKGKGNAMKKGK